MARCRRSRRPSADEKGWGFTRADDPRRRLRRVEPGGRRRAMRNVLEGLFWLTAYLALVLLPLWILMIDPPPGLGFWWDFALAAGFAALSMLCVQFVLTARFRRATAPYGIDIIYFLHRDLAVVALLFVVAHACILLAQNPAFLATFDPRRAPGHMFSGAAATGVLFLLVLSSLCRKQLRLEYDLWRIAHAVLAVAAVLLALIHVTGASYYLSAPWKRTVWTGIVAGWASCGLHARVVRPWRLSRRPYRVTDIEEERGSAWTLTLEPVGHAGFAFLPGQFAWVTLRASPFAMKEHPFSISSAPQAGGRLQFTIKELGDFTRTVRTIRPGETAHVDGPYGALTIDRHPAPGYVFIGGGIGMAPLMSMMKALAERGDSRRHVLFMANGSRERATFWEAVEQLSGRLNLYVVHVLEEPPAGWSGERGRVTREVLERHLPENRQSLEYFLCGPRPMIAAVERALHELGIPLARFHSELFDLV